VSGVTDQPRLDGTDQSQLAAHVMSLGDDALVLSHRLSEWITKAPQIEEDMALANLSLDLLGQARHLLSYAGELEGQGRDEDDLAFLRSSGEFLNVQLVEQENGDFAQTIARQLLFSTYQLGLYDQLHASRDETLAAIAARAIKEVRYHVDHAVQWTLRLGDGSNQSHRRMQDGLERMWPFVDELFEPDPATEGLVSEGLAVDPQALRPDWDREIDRVIKRATLLRPTVQMQRTGGRRGRHTAALAPMLEEMQQVHRAHPGVSW
jgi:ring-1,2-phenylacetyl-CoA epoxidase subunit PaaC